MHGSGVSTIPLMAMAFYLYKRCTYAYDARRALSSASILCVFHVNDDNDDDDEADNNSNIKRAINWQGTNIYIRAGHGGLLD